MPIRAAVSCVVLLLGLLMPAPALACPVCGLAGTGESGWAYLAGTIMLSVLPLGMIGGVAFWVYRRVQKAETASSEH